MLEDDKAHLKQAPGSPWFILGEKTETLLFFSFLFLSFHHIQQNKLSK